MSSRAVKTGFFANKEKKQERNFKRLTEGHLSLGVLRFGLPLVIGMGLHTLFNLIDMFMIGRLQEGTEGLAALGVCDMIAALATIVSNGASTAAVAVISRRLGEKDTRGIRRATWLSLWMVGAFSVAFGLLGLFGSDVLIRDIMQVKGLAADLAVPYLRIILGGCFSIFFLLQITAVLRALGSAKSAAALLVGGNLLNILLNILFIYGTGPRPEVFAWADPLAQALAIPRMGVVGAAWATLLGRTVPVLFGIFLLVHRKGGPRFHRIYLRPIKSELATLWRIGWPSSAQLIVRVGAVLAFISLVSSNYTTVGDQSSLTAFSICLRLETMALFIGMGWGAAASTFVGANLGAGQRKRAQQAGWIAASFNFFLMIGLVATYMHFAEPIIGFFDHSPKVIQAGREYLRIVGLSYCVLGVALVLSQAMTGAGATLSSLVIDGAFLLFLVVPASIIVTEYLRLPPVALWTTIAMGNLAAAVAYTLWYARGAFLEKKV
ncbi:MAG: MATE family efflux transporter [Myxococcales bacterium]|nr:MAG: MATE family efflux transporter [Myxococcales bacterium]